jgi:hypothetical protein
MNAGQIVNKLLEAGLDEPEANLDRISHDIYQTSDLPAPLKLEVKRVRIKLEWTARALAALTANSGLDERDDAVSKLGYCSEVLDKLQYEFPAHDWVKQTLREASERLMYLLNSDTFAQPDDAKAVAGIIGLLDKVLK